MSQKWINVFVFYTQILKKGGIHSLNIIDNEQDRLIDILTDELPVLRARLKISQDELSRRIGISRQTYSLIETKKQKMTWITFMALIAFFENNVKTKVALIDIGLITDSSFKALLQKS